MRPTEKESLLKILAFRSRHWPGWLKFLNDKWKSEKFPPAGVLVQLLRVYLNGQELTGNELLKTIREEFGISKYTDSGPISGPLRPGQGWAKISRRSQELFGHDVAIGVGEASERRKLTIEAHEIAHLFYALLCEQTGEAEQIAGERLNKAERYCWEFALSVFCPINERSRWNANYLARLLNPKERQLVSGILPERLRHLTFFHIRELARNYNISMRMVVLTLDRHPLLDEVSCGVGIFKRMPNPSTASEPALRVWQVARPSWGHLIKNQRVAKQGFDACETVYRYGKSQSIEIHLEQLNLKCFSKEKRLKWPMRVVDTFCSYTPVDVTSEGRYVLAIWFWDRDANGNRE